MFKSEWKNMQRRDQKQWQLCHCFWSRLCRQFCPLLWLAEVCGWRFSWNKGHSRGKRPWKLTLMQPLASVYSNGLWHLVFWKTFVYTNAEIAPWPALFPYSVTLSSWKLLVFYLLSTATCMNLSHIMMCYLLQHCLHCKAANLTDWTDLFIERLLYSCSSKAFLPMNWHAGQSGLLSFQLSEKNACCSTWRTGHCIRSVNTNAM